MEKKYILTDETITLRCSVILHRIKAIRSFGNVKEGDLGGWIEKEDNLSHEGDCWVFDNGMVCDNAKVYDNANVYGNAKVSNNACVYGNAKVYGNSYILLNSRVCDNAKIGDNAIVYDNAHVYGNVQVYGHAKVYNNACVFDNAKVYDDAYIYGDAIVLSHAYIYDNAKVHGNARVYGHAKVYNNACVFDNAHVYDDAVIFNNTQVHDKAEICGDAIIQSNNDYIVFKNWWSSGRYFTWTRSNNMWCVGCFYGTGEELVKKAYKDSKICGREYKKIVKYVEKMLLREKITNFFSKTLVYIKKKLYLCTRNQKNYSFYETK